MAVGTFFPGKVEVLSLGAGGVRGTRFLLLSESVAKNTF